jgi:hypothetical protein
MDFCPRSGAKTNLRGDNKQIKEKWFHNKIFGTKDFHSGVIRHPLSVRLLP